MKKGFTLIELLAVIIILAIVALIATPLVLDVVNDAKDSAAKSEAAMIVSGVNNYCAASAMKEQLTGETDICKDGVTPDEVKIMVDLGNAKVNSITYDGKVTSLEVESNNKVVKYDGNTYTVDGEVIDTPDEPVTPPTQTYDTYSVGDKVTLIDGTTWVVVKNTTSSESEIKLMATSNVKANLTTETGKDIFVNSGHELAYDGSGNMSNVWETSTLKQYLDGTVKTRIETSLNTTLSDITIWGAEELMALGCTLTGNATDGYSAVSCDNTKAWYSDVFKNGYSWINLPSPGVSYQVWYVNYIGNFFYNSVNVDYVNGIGARPIITVSKEAIAQQYYAYGLPTTESSTDYQSVITESGSNAFVKLEGEQLSVCIYRNNTLECFKNNNYAEESVHVQNVFGADSCTSDSSGVACSDVDIMCHAYSDGLVDCSDDASWHYCLVYSDNRVLCN